MKRFDYCYPSASDQRQAANGRNLCRHTSTLVSALLESATDVEEVHRAMEVIAKLVPDLEYVRLAPRDVRCDMELDCVDPVKWQELEAAADDYIQASPDAYRQIADVLLSQTP